MQMVDVLMSPCSNSDSDDEDDDGGVVDTLLDTDQHGDGVATTSLQCDDEVMNKDQDKATEAFESQTADKTEVIADGQAAAD